MASPIGASPDDDFHLSSIWCAQGDASSHCEDGAGEFEKVVPAALLEASCYSFDPKQSADCQYSVDFDSSTTRSTERYNAYGAYPPVYYAVMSVFVGDDVQASALVMRFVNVILFTALASALFLLLPRWRRPTLAWAWLLTTIPLGLFILSSNNPSSWAIMGVGFSWLALLGFFESAGWRRWALGGLFVLTAVMAAGSRGDAALYTLLGVGAVLFLTFRWERSYLLRAILPVAVAIACLLMFRFSRPIETVTDGGVDGGDGGGSLIGMFGYNLLQTPFLWSGVFGNQWGLGWMDTSMPAAVWAAGMAAFIGVGFMALRGAGIRRLLVLAGGGILLWVFPALFLASSGDFVGENFQPRYLLPLIVLFAGILLLRHRGRPLVLGRTQSWLVWASVSGAQAVALHVNMQRYVHGTDDPDWNLNANIEWWWASGPSPMVVWVVVSLAFAALAAIVLRTGRAAADAAPTLSGEPLPVSHR